LSEALVLVVDDDRNVRDTVRDVLAIEDIPVQACGPEEDILGMLRAGTLRVVVTDLNMPTRDGVELVQQIGELERELGREIPVFVITGAGGESRLQDALDRGARGAFPKPFDLDEFTGRIRQELERLGG